MELLKRSFIIFCLGWLTSLVLTSYVAGYYYLEFQKEAQLSSEYADKYNDLVQNYTGLLNEYLGMVQQYESKEQNLTELLEEYESCIMQVSICIDYKEWNGTVVWYNDTTVPLGCSLLQATERVAVVNFTYWPALQASFIDAINGVRKSSLYYWMWLYQEANSTTWTYGSVGADLYTLESGQVLMWRYEIPP
ncbi:MAG: DUF4430 domain-containing protein [Candidatus Bathyarchaeota archaeon]